MFYERFDIILALLVAATPVGFFTTYAIAVYNEHVEPGFPYISDTGTLPPESCIFAQFLSFGAFANIIIAFVRYHHIKLCIETCVTPPNLPKLNRISLYIGITSSVGVSLVGNFQETNVVIVHFIGAFLAFGSLLVYCTIQTYIAHTYRHVLYSTQRIFYFRVTLCTLATFFGFCFALFKQLANRKFHGTSVIKWLPTDGGFAEHVVSTVSEWLLCILLMICMLTFIDDFKRVKVTRVKVHDEKMSDLTPVGISPDVTSGSNPNYNYEEPIAKV